MHSLKIVCHETIAYSPAPSQKHAPQLSQRYKALPPHHCHRKTHARTMIASSPNHSFLSASHHRSMTMSMVGPSYAKHLPKAPQVSVTPSYNSPMNTPVATLMAHLDQMNLIPEPSSTVLIGLIRAPPSNTQSMPKSSPPKHRSSAPTSHTPAFTANSSRNQQPNALPTPPQQLPPHRLSSSAQSATPPPHMRGLLASQRSLKAHP